MGGELVVTEVDEYLLPKFKTTLEKTVHLDQLEFWEQELYEQTKEDFFKFRQNIRKDVSTACSILCSIFHLSIRNLIETELEHQAIVKNNRFDKIKLFQLVRNNYNKSSAVVIGNVIGNLIKILNNWTLVRGEEYEFLGKCMEASNHKNEVLEQSGFSITKVELMDLVTQELTSNNKTNDILCKTLVSWSNAQTYGTDGTDVKAGTDTLTKSFRARIFIKSASKTYEQFRRDTTNGYMSRIREKHHDVAEANK